MPEDNAFQKVYAPYVDTWSPSLLRQTVNARRIVFAAISTRPGASCQLALTDDGAFYQLTGPSGIHRLSVPSTDAKRLQAHWDGFCQNNGVTPFRR